jgi:hypothetical protein
VVVPPARAIKREARSRSIRTSRFIQPPGPGEETRRRGHLMRVPGSSILGRRYAHGPARSKWAVVYSLPLVKTHRRWRSDEQEDDDGERRQEFPGT